MKPLIPWFEPPHFTLIDLPPVPAIGFAGAPITIHSFGILVAAGFLIGTHVAQRKAQRDGMDPDVLGRLVSWLVLGTFVGGHIFHGLFYEPEIYLRDPIQFLFFWKGLSSVGGFIACAILSVWFFRQEKVPVWAYCDATAYGLAFGYFFGRMGCFTAHDHPGQITNFWLGVYGNCPPQGQALTIACHDLGLYEALYILGVFGIFWVLDKKPRPEGLFLGLLPVFYGTARFFFDFLRLPDGNPRYLGLTPAQYVAIGMVLLGIWIVSIRRSARPVRGAAAPSGA